MPKRNDPQGPLRDVMILDLSWHLAGPYCSMVLADLGARVIKVERPGSLGGYDPGGIARFEYKGQDVHYIALNRNKESVVLDLKSSEGHRAFLALAEHADVVFNNFRPGTMARLGLALDDLKGVNPDIILASLSAFGATGPDQDRPGVDLVIQAESGGMSMTGHPGESPVRAGIPIADLAGGMWSAIAIQSALRERDRWGGGAKEIDISLFDAHLSFIPYFSAYLTTNGFVPGPQGSGGHSPTYGAFEAADGTYIVLAVIDQEPWTKLCHAMDAPELLEDARFASAALRIENEDAVRVAVEEIIASRPSSDWLDAFRKAGIPSGRVNDLRDALAHPQVAARDMLVDVDDRAGGSVQLLGTPVKMTDYEPTFSMPPMIGQDTDEVLHEFGIEP